MVLAHSKDGNLRNYLQKNFSTLKWKEKLPILCEIAFDLKHIHGEKYIHKNFHCGNILQFYLGLYGTKITDLGISRSILNTKNPNSTSVQLCGVLPYIAPEVLNGNPYTSASDIYSFGIIMIEMSTGNPPYASVSHDEKLALAICNGLRPRVAKGTPQCYIDLINKCLDANPQDRPTARELSNIINDWVDSFDNDTKKNSEPIKDFLNADDINDININSREKPISETTIHPKAIYTSRIMTFTNLSGSINSTRVETENPKGKKHFYWIYFICIKF